MHSKHNTSVIKKMTLAERKAEAMRQLKASYELAARKGTLRTREAKAG